MSKPISDSVFDIGRDLQRAYDEGYKQGKYDEKVAAIGALKEHRALYCDNTPDTFSKLSYAEKSRVDELDTAIATLVNLPSAQPEIKTDGDTISRQAAIDKMMDLYNEDVELYGVPIPEGFDGHRAVEAIKEIPSAEPERKKGEWIPEFNGKFTGGAYWFSCSKCRRIVPEVRNGGWDFCPNCGCRMTGGEDNDL